MIDRIQNMLLGMEERSNVRFDRVEARLDSLETKVDSIARELKLNNELLGPFIHWSHRVEDEIIRLSAQLQEVQARLAKLEHPPAH